MVAADGSSLGVVTAGDDATIKFFPLPELRRAAGEADQAMLQHREPSQVRRLPCPPRRITCEGTHLACKAVLLACSTQFA